MTAFVLISTRPAMELAVYNELLKNKLVKDVHPLFGEFDLIIKLEVDGFDTLGRVVVEEIRTIEGVQETKTLTGIQLKGVMDTPFHG
jgi:DNA-binding Lrp family transcriptional regulator